MCRDRAVRPARALVIGLVCFLACLAVGAAPAVAHGAGHGGHSHHQQSGPHGKHGTGHGRHGDRRHHRSPRHSDRRHDRRRHHSGDRSPHANTNSTQPSGQRSRPATAPPSAPAPVPVPSSTPLPAAAEGAAEPVVALARPQSPSTPRLGTAPNSGISLPTATSTTKVALSARSTRASATPHTSPQRTTRPDGRLAAAASPPGAAMFGIDDSVLLAAILALLTIGIAIMLAASARPRRSR
jgi:hypothetical protein